jgi:tRNA(Ile)-lysidine synthase
MTVSHLLDSLHWTIETYELIAPGDSVLVATSGGPDSLALLHALHSCREDWGLADIQAAHLDHGLRGEESAAEAQFVADWCQERQIACTVGLADIKTEQRGSIQEAARAARYAFLETTAAKVGANKIAMGHTQDDQVETVLLNILRGTGLDGLRGIPRQRQVFIRPLRDMPRTAVEEYCAHENLAPRRDPSNADPSHYTRNRVRLELLPLLERDYHPAVREALLRLSETATRDADYLHMQAADALKQLMMAQSETQMVLDAHRLRTLHPSLLRSILRQALTELRGTALGVIHDHLELICEALDSKKRLPFGLTTPLPHCAVRVTLRRVTLKI